MTNNWQKLSVPEVLRRVSPKLKGFQRNTDDGTLTVFAGPESTGFHLSISFKRFGDGSLPSRYPTWDEIRQARYAFAPQDITLAMLLPPKDEYVNLHETTFHLWEV